MIGFVTLARWLAVVAGVVIWGAGLYLLADGAWGLGGGLMLLGGMCIVIAASGGWSHFWEGLGNWLYFWR